MFVILDIPNSLQDQLQGLQLVIISLYRKKVRKLSSRNIIYNMKVQARCAYLSYVWSELFNKHISCKAPSTWRRMSLSYCILYIAPNTGSTRNKIIIIFYFSEVSHILAATFILSQHSIVSSLSERQEMTYLSLFFVYIPRRQSGFLNGNQVNMAIDKMSVVFFFFL